MEGLGDVSTLPVFCPVCQIDALQPPKACEFCPESVLQAMDDIDRMIERLAALSQTVERVPAPAPA